MQLQLGTHPSTTATSNRITAARLSPRLRRAGLALTLVTLTTLCVLNRGAAAATYTVTLTTDTGATNSTVVPLGPGTAGDLRNAIFQAAQSPGTANVIDLTGVSGTITLKAMLPPVFTTGSGSLLIIGPGAANLTISGSSGQTTTQTYNVTVLATPYRLNRGAIKLSPRGDTATLNGILYIPQGMSFTDLTINVNIGGNPATFAMNGKTRAKSGGNTFSIDAKANGGDAPFNLKLTGNLAAALKNNAPLDSAGLPTQVTVQLQYSSNYYSVTLPVKFTVNASGATAKYGGQ